MSDADLYNRGYGLVWAARAAGADGDRAALARTVDGIDALGYRGGWTDLARTQAASAILALDGQTSEALAAYRATFVGWKDLGARFGQALCGLEMARRLDPREPEVAATAEHHGPSPDGPGCPAIRGAAGRGARGGTGARFHGQGQPGRADRRSDLTRRKAGGATVGCVARGDKQRASSGTIGVSAPVAQLDRAAPS